MTVYPGRNQDRVRLRPTLRLRLTLLNGILLVAAGAILVLLADLANLRDFFASKPDPLVAQLRFVLNLALAFALSATLTGYIFIQMEQR